MRRITFFFLVGVVLLLAGCVGQLYADNQGMPTRTPGAGGEAQVMAVNTMPATPTSTIQPTATENPYIEISISQTAVAVEQERLYQQAQEITMQAAALEITMRSDNATAVAQAMATQTQKAEWVISSQMTAAAPVTQIAATAYSSMATQTATAKQHQQDESLFWEWLGKLVVVAIALLAIGGMGYWTYVSIHAYKLRISQIKPDEAGRFPIVPEDSLPGNKRVVNGNLMHRAYMGPKDDDLTADQALLNAAHSRQLEGIRALSAAPGKMRQLTKAGTNAQNRQENVDGNGQPLLTEYPLPEWSALMQNWKPGLMALGVNEGGILQADPERYPHLMFAGTTGSGKTRYGVRTTVACALANGWQVVIAGKSLDYKPFEFHPNAHMVEFSMLKDPVRAVALLRDVYLEIERRDRMMSARGYSLWSQTGHTRTMVVVDEFSNLADALEDIDKSKREELWRWARMDTAEARKYGIHMVYALQDPTARSIDLRIRRNTTPVVFRVKDSDSSRTILNTSGAELLPERHFLANMIKLERGAAFAPTDEEIIQFLAAHDVQPVEPPAWIDAQVVDESQSVGNGGEFDIDQKIRTRLLEMKAAGKVSLSQCQREIFDEVNTGGAHFRQVQKVWEAIQADETTTTTGKTKGFETLAA